jgi:UDPglucose--hexose-1-phosphate uridylyltransferase
MSTEDLRVDPVHGTRVHVVGARQGRPNLPSSGCPFCVGGVEAPDPYDVRWFSNRWPAMPDDRCEVILYTPDHDATFASLGVDGARRVVDLWAERTVELGGRPDVHYVLVFENRGPEIGATITHPHGQIYAFDHVPERQRSWLSSAEPPDLDPATASWRPATGGPCRSRSPVRSRSPCRSLRSIRMPDVVSLDADARTALASTLVDVFQRLDALYEQPLPYMMWLNQRPTDGGSWPQDTGSTSRSCRRGGRPVSSGSSQLPRWPPASTSTPWFPKRSLAELRDSPAAQPPELSHRAGSNP